MKITAIKYFEAFEKKDINSIREMFDINVTLRDWEISALGIDSVLAATAKIFYLAETISIQTINIFQYRGVKAVPTLFSSNQKFSRQASSLDN